MRSASTVKVADWPTVGGRAPTNAWRRDGSDPVCHTMQTPVDLAGLGPNSGGHTGERLQRITPLADCQWPGIVRLQNRQALREPEIPVGTGGDRFRAGSRAREGELGERPARADAPDPLAAALCESQVAVCTPGRLVWLGLPVRESATVGTPLSAARDPRLPEHPRGRRCPHRYQDGCSAHCSRGPALQPRRCRLVHRRVKRSSSTAQGRPRSNSGRYLGDASMSQVNHVRPP